MTPVKQFPVCICTIPTIQAYIEIRSEIGYLQIHRFLINYKYANALNPIALKTRKLTT